MKKIIKIYILILSCLLFGSLYANAQQIITGEVMGPNGGTLSGVTVSQLGNSVITATDQSGIFNISVNKLPATLIYTMPGYESTKVTYKKAQSNLVIVLSKIEYQNLAYGKVTKKSNTSSLYTISGDELVSAHATSLLLGLQGRLPGLRVIQNDGEPGSENYDSQIRGYNSPNSNSALFIVDGVERSILGIDPYEVESVTVLKDAAATSLYGMRGSAGVILITTKKGFEGKSKINVSVEYAMQAPTRLPHMVSAFDFATMYNQRLANDSTYADAQSVGAGGQPVLTGLSKFYTNDQLNHFATGDQAQFYPVRDMQKEFLKNYTQSQRVNVNFQGGSKAMHYFTSIGYSSQDGIFNMQNFPAYSYDATPNDHKFNFRTNMDATLNKTLSAFINVGGYIEKLNRPYVASGLGFNELMLKFYQTPNNAYNDLTPTSEVLINRNITSITNRRSIYGDLNRTGSNNATNTRLNNTLGVTKKLDALIPGLSATAQLAFDIYSVNNLSRYRTYETWEVAHLASKINGADSLGYSPVSGSTNSTLSDGQATSFYYMYDEQVRLDYIHTFGTKSVVTGMLMGLRHMQQKQILIASNYLQLGGRFTYAYDNKYFVEANASYMGYDQFAKGKRFGLFPSLSLGWIASNENFLKDSKVLTFLKLRASAGQSGNTIYDYGSANQYLFLSTWDAQANEVQLGNPNLKWETSTKYNVGIETEFFKSFTFAADLFYNNNTGIIISGLPIVPTGKMGIPASALAPVNLGTLTNKGFEVVVGYNKMINRDLSVNLLANMSFAQNKQGYMAEVINDSTYAYPFVNKGRPLYENRGYKTAGFFNTQAEIDSWPNQTALGGTPIPGDIKYLDINNDKVINEKDKSPIGIGDAPEISFGFKAQVVFKGIDISAFFDGSARRMVYLNGIGRWSNQDNFTEYMKNAWTADKVAAGQTILYPRLGSTSTNFIKSDYWIRDGSYIRLRNIEIGYTLPQKISNAIKTGSIRFYFNGLNLFVWDKLPTSDFDPESPGTNNSGYPILKSYNFGLNVKF